AEWIEQAERQGSPEREHRRAPGPGRPRGDAGMSARELEGKVALVTGGSRGIGLAIARALADGGARVAVIGRDGARAEAAAAELPGDGHAGFACDVGVSAEVADTVAAVEKALGPVDILVNNAGITRDNIL